jgi:hypothetical protein
MEGSISIKMLFAAIPADGWADVVLQMLDARDLAALVNAYSGEEVLAHLPSRAVFVAHRVLTDTELAWFVARGLGCALLVEQRTIPIGRSEDLVGSPVQDGPFWDGGGHITRRLPMTMWMRNGVLHRDNDLPAVEWAGDVRLEWWRNGRRHRDGGRPAVVTHPRIGNAMAWYVDGRLHRDDDLPAIEYSGGGKRWVVHGQFHRDGDLPAVIIGDVRQWWQNHQSHRESGPAFVTPSLQIWYWRGKRHRDGGPAVVFNNGDQEWYYHGERHRDGGPAIVNSDGYEEWYCHGE